MTKPGPKPDAWKSDWLAVVYFVMRCLHDGRWDYRRVADHAFDLYDWRLTEREFEVISDMKRKIEEFGTKRRGLVRLRVSGDRADKGDLCVSEK
ncbi:MAG: hypothetical protein ACRD3L_10920 [Terriglobales bacterium]